MNAKERRERRASADRQDGDLATEPGPEQGGREAGEAEGKSGFGKCVRRADQARKPGFTSQNPVSGILLVQLAM